MPHPSGYRSVGKRGPKRELWSFFSALRGRTREVRKEVDAARSTATSITMGRVQSGVGKQLLGGAQPREERRFQNRLADFKPKRVGEPKRRGNPHHLVRGWRVEGGSFSRVKPLYPSKVWALRMRLATGQSTSFVFEKGSTCRTAVSTDSRPQQTWASCTRWCST